MKEIKMTLINTKHFEKCLTTLQGSLGCMIIKKANEVLFYTFDDGDDDLIITTLETETESKLIECKDVDDDDE